MYDCHFLYPVLPENTASVVSVALTEFH
uniref:Uncharacterized protein n=1 Tax=Anguilla anguilla TaxID=7936 RepID=A0A0E9T8X8_ANGAN